MVENAVWGPKHPVSGPGPGVTILICGKREDGEIVGSAVCGTLLRTVINECSTFLMPPSRLHKSSLWVNSTLGPQTPSLWSRNGGHDFDLRKQ